MLVLLVAISVWVAALVIALALCRPAAAGDRALLDAEMLAVRKAHPELPMSLANLERATGQRKRQEIATARGPATPSGSTARRARARAS